MPGHVLAFDRSGWSIMMGKGMFVVEETMRKTLGEGGSAIRATWCCHVNSIV